MTGEGEEMEEGEGGQQGEQPAGWHASKFAIRWRPVLGVAGRFQRLYQQTNHGKLSVPGEGRCELCYGHWPVHGRPQRMLCLAQLPGGVCPLAEGMLPRTVSAVARGSAAALRMHQQC